MHTAPTRDHDYFLMHIPLLTYITHHATINICHTGEDVQYAYDRENLHCEGNCRELSRFGRDNQTLYQARKIRKSWRLRGGVSRLGIRTRKVLQEKTRRCEINAGIDQRNNLLVATMRPDNWNLLSRTARLTLPVYSVHSTLDVCQLRELRTVAQGSSMERMPMINTILIKLPYLAVAVIYCAAFAVARRQVTR